MNELSVFLYLAPAVMKLIMWIFSLLINQQRISKHSESFLSTFKSKLTKVFPKYGILGEPSIGVKLRVPKISKVSVDGRSERRQGKVGRRGRARLSVDLS